MKEPILALQRQLALLLGSPADAAASRLSLAQLAQSSGHHQVHTSSEQASTTKHRADRLVQICWLVYYIRS